MRNATWDDIAASGIQSQQPLEETSTSNKSKRAE